MKTGLLSCILAIVHLTTYAQDVIPVPNAKQRAWQEAQLGVIFHYDLHVFDGKKYNQQSNRISPVDDYNIFNPAQLNTDQWIAAAKASGATFALVTATHETGFALYQSAVNPYCLKAINWQDGRGDIVRDFVQSCRKYGLQPGIYIGIRWNSFFGVHNFKVDGTGDFRNQRQRYYNAMVEGMVRELCSNYGPLFEIWFDGGASDPALGAPDVLPIVQRLQPQALFYHNAQLAEARWGGSESGTVPYPCWATFPYASADGVRYPEIHQDNFHLLKHGDPDGQYWMPAMSDAPLRGHGGRHEWFWEPGDETHIYPVPDLVNMYYKSVGRNSTLILGLTPDPSGLLPQPDVEVLKAFGDEIQRRFASPVGSTAGKGRVLMVDLEDYRDVNQLILQEEIRLGERVRTFTVEAQTDTGWVEIVSGSNIGHKHIREFKPVHTSKVRLRITKSVLEPHIRSFTLYDVDQSGFQLPE